MPAAARMAVFPRPPNSLPRKPPEAFGDQAKPNRGPKLCQVVGATEWSLATSTGATCYTTPTTATWYVFSGPMAQHPFAAYLKKAGITAATYSAYSWGVTGDQTCGGGITWETNTLIGLSQIGDSLMILSFTSNGVYQSQPADEITYMKT